MKKVFLSFLLAILFLANSYIFGHQAAYGYEIALGEGVARELNSPSLEISNRNMPRFLTKNFLKCHETVIFVSLFEQGFDEKVFDEVSNRFGAHFYDPEVGRFLTLDPARQGLNWYSYCNNPIGFVDPNGCWAESAIDLISLGISINDIPLR